MDGLSEYDPFLLGFGLFSEATCDFSGAWQCAHVTLGITFTTGRRNDFHAWPRVTLPESNSWGWYFIPLFLGFYIHLRWLGMEFLNHQQYDTLSETNGIFALEKGWLEDVFPIEHGDIPASYVTLPEGSWCLDYIWDGQESSTWSTIGFIFRWNTIPNAQCMAYLPTFTINLGQM